MIDRRSSVIADLALMVLLAPLLASCGTAAPIDVAVARDSAGITIVENAPTATGRMPGWAAAPEPSLRIGVVEGDAAYQFDRVRSGARLSDGRIAVIDRGSHQVRVFGTDGRLMAVQGRAGDGPGDYRAATGMWILPGDSIAIFDVRRSRVTILSTDGGAELGRIVTLPYGRMNPELAGTLDHGQRLVILDRQYRMSHPISPQYADVWAADLDGTPPDSLLRVQHGMLGLVRGGQELGRPVGSPIFAARGMVAAHGDRIVFGSGDDYEIHVHDRDGRLRRIIRWHGPDRTISAAEVRDWIERRVAAAPRERQANERNYWELLPVADSKPAHDRLLFDTAGRLWVGQWSADGNDGGSRWWVFDADGGLVATAVLPTGMHVLEMGETEVLGRVVDELDVEYLVVHPLSIDRSN